MQGMLSPMPKSSISSSSTGSFLKEWSEQQLPAYLNEYGGERAGVPKGDHIPFPPHKVRAALALLAYGAPKHETLTAIGRTVRVSSALLRVWRTEERFLALYRRAVWEYADAYICLLGSSWEARRPSPSEEFQKHLGVAVQQAILHRLLVDVIRMAPQWEPLGLTPRWRAECLLVGPPTTAVPQFSPDEARLITFNTHMLLAYGQIGPESRESGLSHWARSMLLRHWTAWHVLDSDVRAAVENNDQKKTLGLIDFLTKGHSPLDDQRELQQIFGSARAARRKR
jgi:hypothetical protein